MILRMVYPTAQKPSIGVLLALTWHCSAMQLSENICGNFTMLLGEIPPQPVATSPYEVLLPFTTFIPEKEIDVVIRSNSTENEGDFYIQAREVSTSEIIGSFMDTHLIDAYSCPSVYQMANNTVQNSPSRSCKLETTTRLKWKPSKKITNIHFSGTFIQSNTTFWTGIKSVELQPIINMTITECCEKEAEASPGVPVHLCSDAFSDGSLNSTILRHLNINSKSRAVSSNAYLLRCALWSNCTLKSKIVSINNCCLHSNLTETCQGLCNTESFLNFRFSQTNNLSKCILEEMNFLSCLLNPDVTLKEMFCNNVYCGSNSHCAVFGNNASCSCNEGFITNGSTCKDVDECSENTSQCHFYANCLNTNGSYLCQCEKGFTGNGFICIDINECEAGLLDCYANSTCINTIGSYACMCPDGFTGNGTLCTDINECDDDDLNCTQNSYCNNTVGGYTCGCADGFFANGTLCSDINECEADIFDCTINSYCYNMVGSYTCLCINGFTGNGSLCRDINECDDGLSNCSAYSHCINTVGSYMCLCIEGFSDNGTLCTDIDECLFMEGNCSINSECNNFVGSYSCECKVGYTGNGTVCIGSLDYPYPENSTGIIIVSTILANIFVTSEIQLVVTELEKSLIIPAISNIEGYSNVRLISVIQGSLIIETEGVFVVDNHTIPSVATIRQQIVERANDINYLINIGGTLLNLDPTFDIYRAERNGMCNSGTCNTAVKTNTSVTCVEVGLSTICLCTNFTGDDKPCNLIIPPVATTTSLSNVTFGMSTSSANTNSLSTGAIAGIVIGTVIFLILVVVVICWFKFRRSKEVPSIATYYSSSYVDPQVVQDPIYMEITSTRPISSQDSDYIDLSEAYYKAAGDPDDKKKCEENIKGYEFAADIDQEETSEKEKPKLVGKDSSGYLVPDQINKDSKPPGLQDYDGCNND